MIGYPLDSHVTYDPDGTPVFDRGISSAPLRTLIRKLFSDGIMPNPSTNMQVVAGSGMTVEVQRGFAITGGCMKLLEDIETLSLDASDANLNRYDAVVLRLDDNDNVRTCDLAIRKGTAASDPVPPELRRDDVIWEICLALVYVPAHSSSVLDGNITDTRLDTEKCGYISSISEFDTTTLYKQIQSDLAYFREEEQARLMAWFNTFIDELTQDQAINLQNQINVLDYKINNLDVLDSTEEVAANTDPGKITGALATKSLIDSLNALQWKKFGSIKNNQTIDISSLLTDKKEIKMKAFYDSTIYRIHDIKYFDSDDLTGSRYYTFGGVISHGNTSDHVMYTELITIHINNGVVNIDKAQGGESGTAGKTTYVINERIGYSNIEIYYR